MGHATWQWAQAQQQIHTMMAKKQKNEAAELAGVHATAVAEPWLRKPQWTEVML